MFIRQFEKGTDYADPELNPSETVQTQFKDKTASIMIKPRFDQDNILLHLVGL